ncbi:MAG TPA: cyclase family protein [Candidatus Saccharimonadales bacterium]|nr:cyclase family protein [Candidatus Saccharimonadales bacterium]
MTIIDLTVPLNPQTPTYEGDPPTKLEPVASVDKDGYSFTYLSVNSHTGTHVDAPSHMLPEGAKGLDSYPADHFVGRGVYVDVTSKIFDLAAIQQVGIQPGDIVLFHTGLSKAYHEAVYYESYPAMREDVARYLVGQKVKMVGVDMCGLDYEPFPIHKILLSSDVLIIENLANLDQLTGKAFDVYALPLKIDTDGSPARVIAVVKEPT